MCFDPVLVFGESGRKRQTDRERERERENSDNQRLVINDGGYCRMEHVIRSKAESQLPGRSTHLKMIMQNDVK